MAQSSGGALINLSSLPQSVLMMRPVSAKFYIKSFSCFYHHFKFSNGMSGWKDLLSPSLSSRHLSIVRKSHSSASDGVIPRARSSWRMYGQKGSFFIFLKRTRLLMSVVCVKPSRYSSAWQSKNN